MDPPIPEDRAMTADRNELHELRERIAKLSPEQRMMLAEEILSDIRREHFTDHEANRRAMEQMLTDPEYQRVLNNQDLPYLEETRDAG
jgi:hypothetical protein